GFPVFCLLKSLSSDLQRLAPGEERKTERPVFLSSVFSNLCPLICGASRRGKNEKPSIRFPCLLSSQVSVL
ncbi:MAG: hypothetical protein LBD06_04200, partial [Candidatus Accumulibacter sp.]|nr:hypothetical protein [Accumulibacter sp.]